MQYNEINQGQFILSRLDRIPIWPFSNYLIFIIGIGFFFAFFDIVTVGLAIPVFKQQFHVSLSMALLPITSSLLGYIIGSFIDSRISDLFGRRLALLISIFTFSIGSLLSATSSNIYWLIIWRFVIGMGIGSEVANVSTYISELAPASCRGKISAYTASFGFIGLAIVPFFGLLLIPNFNFGWRILFAAGGLGGVLTFILRRYIPQSIRWHVAQGHLQYAEKLLIKAEQLAEKKLGRALPAIKTFTPVTLSSGHWINLFKKENLLQTIYFAILWFIYYLGNYGWLTLSTDLFLKEHFSLAHSMLLVSINSLGFILGSIFAIYFSDRFERKWTLSIIAFCWTILLFIIGWYPNVMTISICGFFAATTISALVPLLYTFTAESFPTAFRATGVAITDGLGHLGGAFCGQIILGCYAIFAAKHFGFQAAFTVMAITGFITAILLLFGKKMTRKQLQQ